MKDWQRVYASDHNYRAEIVKAILKENNIPAVVISKKDSALQMFGRFEVHVSPDDLLHALKIVENEIKFK